MNTLNLIVIFVAVLIGMVTGVVVLTVLQHDLEEAEKQDREKDDEAGRFTRKGSDF